MAVMKRAMALAIVVVLVLAAADVGAVEPHKRSGFFVGFGLGFGYAAWEWAIEADDNPGEMSGAAHLRIGGAVRDNVLLGLEASTWVKHYDRDDGGIDIGDASTTFSATTFAATWFPGNMGVFVRGGVGVAIAQTNLDLEIPDLEFLSFSKSDQGLAVLGAVGYEIRLTDKFAIGPEVEVFFLGIDGDLVKDVVVVDGAIEFIWYW